MPNLRTRQRESARALILDAAQRLVVEHHGWTLSMEQVAERAGVSRRTLYRHFPTKVDLLEAASREWGEPNLAGNADGPRLEELQDYLTGQWEELHANLPAVLAQQQSPSGRDMRRRFLPRARTMARRELARQLSMNEKEIPGLDDLADLIVVLISSSAFVEYVDHLGRTPGDAARMATWAAEAIVQRARRDGGMAG